MTTSGFEKGPPFWNFTAGFHIDHVYSSACHFASACQIL